MFRPLWILLVAPLFLGACGSMQQDRLISGGGIGAAGGAILGAVTGLTVVQGALIGTGLGAAIGGLTSADQFNLGEPFWRQFGSDRDRSAIRPKGYSESVAHIQRDLARLGYDPGPVDGLMGPRTRAAIARFENDQSPKTADNPVDRPPGESALAPTAQKQARN
jgi:peptidoglycan hydrolase-like protein with peptidoglycan-binding domain